MIRDAQFGPKTLIEPNSSAIQGTYYSACESVDEEDKMKDTERPIDALRAEIAMLRDDAAGKELMIARLVVRLGECANALESWIEEDYHLKKCNYPPERLRYERERDMEPVHRARELIQAERTKP